MTKPIAYLLRRADWPAGELKPFLQNHKWASESYPLYLSKEDYEKIVPMLATTNPLAQ